jgi:hypothetical protein
MADTGLGSAILQGMTAGNMLGDRIANLRSNNRMQDLQDQINSGAFNADKFGGDQGAAQQALYNATRQAQEPLSARGLDDSYGTGQYDRMAALMALRQRQSGASQIDQGNVAQGVRTGAMGSAIQGDIPGALQAGQFAANVDTGTNAVNNTGAMQGGVAPGDVNQQQLAQGVASNAARYGDAQGAAGWGDKNAEARDALVQQNLGRGLTIAMNPALGGIDGAVGHFDAAAKLMGYGGVAMKNGVPWVTDAQGNGVAELSPENIQEFAGTIGNNPSQIMPAIRARQAQQAADMREQQKFATQKGTEASIDAASKAGDPAMLRALERGAAQSLATAKAGGWDMVGQAQDVQDDKGNVTGKAYLVKNEATGQPMRMIVSSSTDASGDNPIQLQDYQGRPMDPNQLPAKAAASIALAQRAVKDQAMADFYDATQRIGAMRQSGIQRAAQAWGAGGAMGGGFTLPGQQPQQGTSASTVPQGNSQWEQNARNYQSPLAAYDLQQMRAESGGNQGAVSGAGARGVMQLMPATARQLEKQLGMPEGETDRNPAANAYAGRVYRDQLYADAMKKTGDPAMSLAYALKAYNAGPAGLNRQINSGKLVPETANYMEGPLKGAKGKSKDPTSPAPQARVTGPALQTRNALLNLNSDMLLAPRR